MDKIRQWVLSFTLQSLEDITGDSGFYLFVEYMSMRA